MIWVIVGIIVFIGFIILIRNAYREFRMARDYDPDGYIEQEWEDVVEKKHNVP